MDLKIQSGLDAANPLQSSPTEAVSVGGGGHDGRPVRLVGGDSISISDLSTRISEALSAAELSSANRVSRLAALYSSGAYQIDSTKLSRAIVDRALGPEGL